jgi:hypothetical protein
MRNIPVTNLGIGDVVAFTYSGGSHPNCVRVVEVVNVTISYIDTVDLLVNKEPRRFNKRLISNVTTYDNG